MRTTTVGAGLGAGLTRPSGDFKTGLLMTDYAVAAALVLSTFWVLDPLRWSLDRIGVVKHFPLLMLLTAVAFGFIGAQLFPRARILPAGQGIVRQLWPLLAFAGGVLAGSFYGRFHLDVANSFMNMGLFVLVAPLLAWIVRSMAVPVRWADLFFAGVALLAAGVGVMQWITFGSGNIFHGNEFLVLPIAVFFWFKRFFWPLRLLVVLYFLTLAVAQHKNTGYLISFCLVVYLAFWAIRGRLKLLSDPLLRARYQGAAALVAMVSVLAAGALFALRGALFPHGNPEYRMHTYQKAVEKFIEAPLAGNFFSGPASERFELYAVVNSVTNVLPTHSDVLDILGNGGLLFSLLFVYGVWRAVRLLFTTIDNAILAKTKAYLPALHGCLAMFLAGLVTLAFNPVLTQPNSALMLWAALGIGTGLALHLKQEAQRELASLWTERSPRGGRG